jgi:hypothetical protein
MRNPTLPCHTRTWVQLEMATFRVLPFTCRLSHLEKQSRTQVGSSTTVPHTDNEPKHFEKKKNKKNSRETRELGTMHPWKRNCLPTHQEKRRFFSFKRIS